MPITQKENNLLQKIKQPFSAKKDIRFNFLIIKRGAVTLSPEEYQELLLLTKNFESYELERLKLLTQLADLKKISLPEVINFYNLHPFANR